mmetsp:Transcript_81/g.98  ORF Transcript_81/g.98 Transcript_81/m.98 type:complete len:213 (-) Transcript_81:408-1046(-)
MTEATLPPCSVACSIIIENNAKRLVLSLCSEKPKDALACLAVLVSFRSPSLANLHHDAILAAHTVRRFQQLAVDDDVGDAGMWDCGSGLSLKKLLPLLALAAGQQILGRESHGTRTDYVVEGRLGGDREVLEGGAEDEWHVILGGLLRHRLCAGPSSSDHTVSSAVLAEHFAVEAILIWSLSVGTAVEVPAVAYLGIIAMEIAGERVVLELL